MRPRIALSLVASLALLVGVALPASADHTRRPSTRNIQAMGHSPQPATFDVPDGQRVISSDIAFQGDVAFQGNYDGFRVIDISDPGEPELISHPGCNGDQGDIVVWDDILVRSWNSPKDEDRDCDGQVVPAGWEGVHIFDISDLENPMLVGNVELPCGSHTVTTAGVDDDDLIVYSNNSSSSGCVDGEQANDDPVGDFTDVIEVPLANPGAAALIHREELAGPTDPAVRTGCHDAAVILGDVDKAACASSDTINVWDITDPKDPAPLFTITEDGVGDSTTNGRWHSAAFTWDGEVIVGGWEPGGGGEAECQNKDPDVDKSMFFYSGEDGTKLGQWVLPRNQNGSQNCTIHNYNVVPLANRYVAVSGNYQGGTWATEFTDPANPETVAWSDPRTLGKGPFCPSTKPGCQLGGAWSSYWYNGFIHESDITRGLNVFLVLDPATAGAMSLARLNPQTQEFTIP